MEGGETESYSFPVGNQSLGPERGRGGGRKGRAWLGSRHPHSWARSRERLHLGETSTEKQSPKSRAQATSDGRVNTTAKPRRAQKQFQARWRCKRMFQKTREVRLRKCFQKLTDQQRNLLSVNAGDRGNVKNEF